MLNSGTLLIPTGFADRTELQEGSGSTCQVRIHQTGFVKAGVRPIETEARAEIDTVFTFAPGIITREDTIRIAPDLVADIDCLRLQCDILAGQVEASGYEHCEHLAPEVVCLDTPHGRCREAVRHTLRSFPSDGVIHVRWTYHY